MRKTKAQHGPFWRGRTLLFVVLWAATYMVSWLSLIPIFTWINQYRFTSASEAAFIIAAFVTFVPALLQVPLVERLLKYSMRRWIPYAFANALLTAITCSGLLGISSPPRIVAVLALFLPSALVPMVWLRSRVKNAWLWPLATLVAGLVFSLPLQSQGSNQNSTLTLAIAGVLYGLIQGGIMRFLWTQPKETEKAKLDAASEQIRSDRLRETDEMEVPLRLLYADQQKTQRSEQ